MIFPARPTIPGVPQQSIPGADVVVMREHPGHFPMSENPAQFRGYLLPILEKISVLSS